VPSDYDVESTIVGTWTVTAKNHHQQYSGELHIEIETLDITEPLREYLWTEVSETDETD
jgi:hypothetical protein